MPKFRKKPVVVDAFKASDLIRDAKVGFSSLPQCVQEVCTGWVIQDRQIDIPTLEGTMTAGYGDWIIRGVKGEFYPCKHHIFEATYEPVEDE